MGRAQRRLAPLTVKIDPFLFAIGTTTFLLALSCLLASRRLQKRHVPGLNLVLLALGIAYLCGTFFQFSAAFSAPYITETWFLLLRRNVNIGTNIMWILFVFGVASSTAIPEQIRNAWHRYVQ